MPYTHTCILKVRPKWNAEFVIMCSVMKFLWSSMRKYMKKYNEILSAKFVIRLSGERIPWQSVHKLIFSIKDEDNLRLVKKIRQFLECKICNTKFNGSNAELNLETHIIRKCKDFKCLNCQNTFSSKDNLKQHMNTHKTLWAEFTCHQCNFKNNYKSNLKKHFKRQHPEWICAKFVNVYGIMNIQTL